MLANSGSASLSSTNKWHSTATHTSSSITTTQGYRNRPSIPLSDISSNINAAAMRTFSRRCVYVKEVISVNNSASHLPLVSSDNSCTSASECESGELSSDEYPSQIKVKPKSISHFQENPSIDLTHEMGTLAQLLNHSFTGHKNISMMSQRHESDIHRHEVPDNRMRSSSSISSTPRIESPRKTRRMSDHLSTTIERQKTRSEQRNNAYIQLKHLAQRRLNVVAELVTLDEQYEATLGKLLLPGNH
ncbi:unnamed protein product [Rotaria socialis]|uniref:Uncharacterized protein n=1 Tax=Rotaria socialis TaxID=392032 RepID=A0A820MAU8_9BILA|nr:unnamed protein product [Rotaria socialis]CAF3387145.1 unnamed protein product [Rotaria socialis]CAF3393514.1 unnamed protein product [Rotaria socialis]CAF3444032.1 unnamed protein product [Rotaria socialis]CAF3579782.1 unnamed protein product [Rotaria socialis]